MDAVMTVWPSELCIVLNQGQKSEERRHYHTAGDSDAAQESMVGQAVLGALRDGITSISVRIENHDD